MIRNAVRLALLRAAFSASVVTLAASATVWSQTQSINGTIRGQAVDPSGASLAGASVAIKNNDLGYTRTVEANEEGIFLLQNLPLGNYTVVVSKEGFSPLTFNNVVLTAGKEATLDAKLTIGTATQVEVTATAIGIDPSTLNVQRTISQREIESAPLTSRNPYNFILFQPGVSGHPNQELGIPRTLNTNGLLNRINYQLDGMVNTESDRTGLRLFPIGTIFVKEVQTVSNGSAPEFGWTTGNVYNVISNSGTNSFHGLFQWIKRWQDATAFPLLSNSSTVKPNLELNNISANAGGRVIKDKLFFFGAYEQLKRGSPSPVTITAANAAAIGLPASETATANGRLNGKFMDARADWFINQRNQAFIRYNYFKNTFPQNTQVGGINARSAGADFTDRAHVIGFQLVSTVSDHLVNEFRFSWPLRASTTNANYGQPGPAIVITNVAAFNASSSGGTTYNEKTPNGSDNITYTRGNHTIKGGFLYSQIMQRQRSASFQRYTFASVANYLLAKNGTNPYAYANYANQRDVAGVGYASQFFGLYVQDTWQVSPRLMVIYGGRYDRFGAPASNPNAPYVYSRNFNVAKTNFSPRFGFSYRVKDGTVIKASAGIFYGQPPTNVWYNALNFDGSNRTNTYTYTIGTTVPAGAPAFPNLPASGLTPIQNVTTVSPFFKNEYAWNVSLKVDQQLTKSDTLQIGYIMANGRNLLYQRNINLINPTGALADGRPIFNTAVSATTRANPQFDQVNMVSSGSTSSFNALIVEYGHSVTRGVQFRAGYTWSHSINGAPEVNGFEQNASIEDTTNLRRDRGNSLSNRPSAFNATAVIGPTFSYSNRFVNRLMNDNLLTVLGVLSSGDQSSITVSNSPINGDSSVSTVTRPAFVGRNSVRGPNIYQVDMRYTRSFPKLFERIAPQFLIEANNVFNHSNITGLTTTQAVTTGNGGGVPTAAAPVVTRSTVLEARIVQFGLAVRW